MTSAGAGGPLGAGDTSVGRGVGVGSEAGDSTAADALVADIPIQMWGPLLRAVRRAVEEAPRSQLPAALRPFATWKPDRLVAERPRRAIAAALVEDPRLRERVGEALADPEAWSLAEEQDAARLAERVGMDMALAALVSRARWDDVAALSAAAAEQVAAAGRAAADRGDPPRPGSQPDTDALERQCADLRRVAADERRRADAAELRAAESGAALERLQSEAEEAREAVRRMTARLEDEQRAHRDRLARLQRRVARAEARAQLADGRADEIAGALEGMAARVRGEAASVNVEGIAGVAADEGAGEETASGGQAEQDESSAAGGGPSAAATRLEIPREVAPAVPGRPCRLPPGVHEDQTTGVISLLQVPRIRLLIDGYNVSMDVRGVPAARIDDQRSWLLQVAAGVAARYGARPVIVFDGQQPRPGRARGTRGVLVVFSEADETADERIVDLLEGLPQNSPALVVSSDSEVRAAAASLQANTTRSGTFLGAVGA